MSRFFSFRGRRLSPPSRRKQMNRVLTGLACICVSLLLLSLGMILKVHIQGEQEQVSFDKLKASVSEAQPRHAMPEVEQEIQPQQMQESEQDIQPQQTQKPQYTNYYALYEQNMDFAAWLTMPNTKIDYPVMHTPQEPEYYLRRAFDGSQSQSGTPFIGAGGAPDSDFFIIYGHNMKNDTMFGTLDRYGHSDFQKENPSFTLTTITEQRTYEVFAAVETRIFYQEESGYRPFFKAGTLTNADYLELVKWLKDNALYDTDITPAYGEQILLLATCSYHTENGRFLVAARRIMDET